MSAGVYIHIPFCKSRCSYCDFATDVFRSDEAVERYVAAVRKEIGGFTVRGVEIDTIYFGGGTPSLLSPPLISSILGAIRDGFDVVEDAEVTMEMNPATVTAESLAAFRGLGVNRASFGVQTFNERDLKLLARGHDANDARQTFRLLREAEFNNVSFDLIAGLPGESLESFAAGFDRLVAMGPQEIQFGILKRLRGTPRSSWSTPTR